MGPRRSRDGHQGRGQPWSGHEGHRDRPRPRPGWDVTLASQGRDWQGQVQLCSSTAQTRTTGGKAVPRPGEAPEETSHSSPNHLTPGYTATHWPEAQVAKLLGWREMPMGSSSTCQGDLPSWWEPHLLKSTQESDCGVCPLLGLGDWGTLSENRTAHALHRSFPFKHTSIAKISDAGEGIIPANFAYYGIKCTYFSLSAKGS